MCIDLNALRDFMRMMVQRGSGQGGDGEMRRNERRRGGEVLFIVPKLWHQEWAAWERTKSIGCQEAVPTRAAYVGSVGNGRA